MVRILVGMYKYSNCLHPRNADFGNSFNPVLSFTLVKAHPLYLQPIITQYFIDNKSEIWLLFLIAHSKR